MSKKNSSDSCLGVLLKMTILMIILLAIILGGGIYGFNKLNEFFNRGSGNVIVPDFRGKHTSEVMKIKPRDIEIVTRDNKYDDRVPKDCVIAQYPEAGTLVKPGKQILLTISMGVQKVNVPDLAGKSMHDADIALSNAQLFMGNTAYISSDNATNRIITQSPLPTEEYGINKNVDLLVSLGKKTETLPLPNIVGANLEAGKTKLKAMGFNIGRTYSKPDSSKAKYQVISTSPAPYVMLKKGETINILVSSGEDSGTASAEDIKRFELTINSIPVIPPEITTEAKPAEATTTTVPAAQTENKPATVSPTPVQTESRKEEPTIIARPADTPITVTTGPATKEETFIMPDGFMPKEVKFVHVKQDGRTMIYSGTHKPLDSIKVKVPIVPNSKIQIYINDVPVDERKID